MGRAEINVKKCKGISIKYSVGIEFVSSGILEKIPEFWRR